MTPKNKVYHYTSSVEDIISVLKFKVNGGDELTKGFSSVTNLVTELTNIFTDPGYNHDKRTELLVWLRDEDENGTFSTLSGYTQDEFAGRVVNYNAKNLWNLLTQANPYAYNKFGALSKLMINFWDALPNDRPGRWDVAEYCINEYTGGQYDPDSMEFKATVEVAKRADRASERAQLSSYMGNNVFETIAGLAAKFLLSGYDIELTNEEVNKYVAKYNIAAATFEISDKDPMQAIIEAAINTVGNADQSPSARNLFRFMKERQMDGNYLSADLRTTYTDYLANSK